MEIMKRILMGLTLAASLCLFAPDKAIAAVTCGMTGGATGATVHYDPFNPTSTSATQLSFTLFRTNNGGADRTNTVDFYIKAQTAAANGTSIIVTNATGQANFQGVGNNIFYNTSVAAPNYNQPPSSTNRYIHVDFTGNNDGSDSVTVVASITLPGNLDLNAQSSNLSFDLVYNCTGQKSDPGVNIVNPGAVSFPVRVLSALQASYVGAALDFGDVTNVTTASLPSGTYQKFGNIRVASSGAYQITAHSQNNFRLVSSGGNANTPAQSLRYTATLVGQARIGVSGSAPILPDIARVCSRAGIGGQLLPLTASLTEGPMAAAPAKVTSVYSDIVTITVTPQVDTVAGTAC